MDCMLDWQGPVYFRINRNDLPFVYSGRRAVLDRQGDQAAGRERRGDFRLGNHGVEGAGGREGSGAGRDLGEGAQRQHHQAAGPRGSDPLRERSGCHCHGRRAFDHRRNRFGRGGGAAGSELTRRWNSWACPTLSASRRRGTTNCSRISSSPRTRLPRP